MNQRISRELSSESTSDFEAAFAVNVNPGEQSWGRAPGDDVFGIEISCPEALPVRNAGVVDASSTATPKSGFEARPSVDQTNDLVI